MWIEVSPVGHPLLRALAAIDAHVDDATELDPTYVPTGDKARALLAVSREIGRLEALRLRLLAESGDVADDRGARSAGVWLASERRDDPRAGVGDQRVADRLRRWSGVSTALGGGRLTLAQAIVIIHALDALPSDLESEVATKAEGQLVADAGHFAPRQLRVLGRRVLEVVAPDLADAEEERLLRAEEDRGRAEARVTFHPRGDGVTDLHARLPDHVADRLRSYLDACTSPRRTLGPDLDRLPLPRRRAEAFCRLLEQVPTRFLPVHGGLATSVMVMIDLDALVTGTGTAALSTGGRLTAAEARRLACTAGVLPVVLGGAGEVLDLGRARRLFSPAQRKAMAVRDRRCREEGCDIPAAWCEAHHAEKPWSTGGRTDVKDGLLLCSFHHHRAHDPRWRSARLPNGDIRFTRRT